MAPPLPSSRWGDLLDEEELDAKEVKEEHSQAVTQVQFSPKHRNVYQFINMLIDVHLKNN